MSTQNKALKSLDETEAMLDRSIEFMKQLDPNDPTSMKQLNMTLQMVDRATKISDTKIRFELMRHKAINIIDDQKKLK